MGRLAAPAGLRAVGQPARAVHLRPGPARAGLRRALADVLLRRPTSGRWADTPGSPAWRRLGPPDRGLRGGYPGQPVSRPPLRRHPDLRLAVGSLQVVNEMKAAALSQLSDWAFLALALAGALALGGGAECRSLRCCCSPARRSPPSGPARHLARRLRFPHPLHGRPGSFVRQAKQFVLTWPRIAVVATGVAPRRRRAGMAAQPLGKRPERRRRTKYPDAAVEHIRPSIIRGRSSTAMTGAATYLGDAGPSGQHGRPRQPAWRRATSRSTTILCRRFGWEKDDELMTARLVLLSKAGPLPSNLDYLTSVSCTKTTWRRCLYADKTNPKGL